MVLQKPRIAVRYIFTSFFGSGIVLSSGPGWCMIQILGKSYESLLTKPSRALCLRTSMIEWLIRNLSLQFLDEPPSSIDGIETRSRVVVTASNIHDHRTRCRSGVVGKHKCALARPSPVSDETTWHQILYAICRRKKGGRNIMNAGKLQAVHIYLSRLVSESCELVPRFLWGIVV